MNQEERRRKMLLEAYLTSYFRENQGLRLGESTVISNKVHGNHPDYPGTIHIYTNLDAGRHYLKNNSENDTIHMDVFHEAASLDPVYVARRVKTGLEDYLFLLHEQDRNGFPKDAVRKKSQTLCQAIYLKTAGGYGTVYDFAHRQVELVPAKARKPQNHVHLLFSMDTRFYNGILFIAEAVELAILNQGYEIRRVEKIEHCRKPSVDESDRAMGIALPGFNTPDSKKHRTRQNQLQIILDLSDSFGSIENAARFLESLTKTKNLFLGSHARKHKDGSLAQTLLELSHAGLVKKGPLSSFMLTEEGQTLRDFIRAHQKELEAQVRKSIRRYKISHHHYKSWRHSQLKARQNQLIDPKKIVARKEQAWISDIAIPETIVKAAIRTFPANLSTLRIKKEDLMVYGQKSHAPIDTCLAIDCSGSMTGDKIKAVDYLARHFLLTSKEKISVVTFQETTSKIAVPFTKNYQKLEEGLSSIVPGGLTPLAKGIVACAGLIKNKKSRNPLMVLITDGIPNYPLWTTDAKKDALKAVKMIAENKIRLVCIGVLPNEDFMTELAEAGRGNLYIVEALNQNSLLDVVSREWADYKYSR